MSEEVEELVRFLRGEERMVSGFTGYDWDRRRNFTRTAKLIESLRASLRRVEEERDLAVNALRECVEQARLSRTSPTETEIKS